jgi:hypothetical protein
MIKLGRGHIASHVDVIIVRLAKERSCGDPHAEDVEPTLGEVKEVGVEER